MVNYRYIPEDLEENHELFVTSGEISVAPSLFQERRVSAALWKGEKGKDEKGKSEKEKAKTKPEKT